MGPPEQHAVGRVEAGDSKGGEGRPGSFCHPKYDKTETLVGGSPSRLDVSASQAETRSLVQLTI